LFGPPATSRHSEPVKAIDIYISIQRFPDGCSQGGGFKVLKITIQNSTAGRELNLNSKITRKAVSVE
jgi:hypothetical protein